jgi:predicted AlkP superfamily phosphohydrolase/phosphomutase
LSPVRPRPTSRRPLRFLLLLCLVAGILAAGCGSRDDRRVLVIGLDGATFSVLDPLIREGALPHLAALRERGREGVLRSTLPVVSPPAWTSAITGVNPGKHNVYDFFHSSASSPQPLLTSSLDRRAHPVWHFLNESGYRTGIMNIPMTFPPDRVDGFFISGFPFGSAKTGFTYPRELEQELGDYPLDLFGESLPPGQEGLLLAHFRRTLDRHSEEALRLLKEKDWNLFWVVLTGTDKVQHFYWKFSDPEHPEYDPVMADQFGSAIRDFWVRVDGAVGRFIEAAGPDADVLVVSDHGFGPIYRELKMWGWLRREGFVEPGNGETPPSLRAFAPGAFGGLVRANVEGRDFGGEVEPEDAPEILDAIRRDLEELRDPVTGEAFVQEVHARDEVYHGPYVHNAPDLVFVEAPGRFVGRGTIPSEEVFGPPSYTFSAFHRPEGILMAAGPHFAPDEDRGEYSILDLAPTLYWLFEVDAPNDLDGRVPPELVGEDSLAARPAHVGEEAAVILPRDAPPEGDREVLESLGYVR